MNNIREFPSPCGDLLFLIMETWPFAIIAHGFPSPCGDLLFLIYSAYDYIAYDKFPSPCGDLLFLIHTPSLC